MSQTNHAARLREMAEIEKDHAQRNAKWFMEEEAAGKYASANVYATVAARQGLNLQALLAGAAAIEAVEVAKGALKECAQILGKQGRDPGHYAPKNSDEKQVLDIAENHGYGNLMALLASGWYAKVRGGAFSVGECVATNKAVADKALTALARLEAL